MISHELSMIKMNDPLRASLAANVEAFLASGGHIDVKDATCTAEKSIAERQQTPNFQAPAVQDETGKQAARIRELAKTLNRTEICEQEGLSLGVLRGIAKRYGITFVVGPKKCYAHNKAPKSREAELVAKILVCMERNITRNAACKEIGISSTLMTRLIKDHSIPYPVVVR